MERAARPGRVDGGEVEIPDVHVYRRLSPAGPGFRHPPANAFKSRSAWSAPDGLSSCLNIR